MLVKLGISGPKKMAHQDVAKAAHASEHSPNPQARALLPCGDPRIGNGVVGAIRALTVAQ